MTDEQRQRLRNIKSFAQLLAFLRDELDWPIEEVNDEDDLTFDWSDDLGLKESERVGIKRIKQLRPLETGQPWGIFFIDFEKKHLPIVILRRILNALVMKKRTSANKSQQAVWRQHDLLFISAYGQEGDRELTFAHFSEPTGEQADTKPTLRVLGWDDEDTNLKLDYVADVLHARLVWPKDTSDLPAWRAQWSQAFELRPRQVIDTAQELALRLAELAKRIRNRAMLVLPRESEKGALRRLMNGFKTALIHDLDDAQFADMYAQTITYGLFSAAVSRTVPGAGTVVAQEDMVAMVPVTNPFLKEMLQSFLKAGGRKGKLDFDELGIQEVVDLLRDPRTRLDLVLKDFGNRRRDEDPVIHFYEDFLSAYNKKLKVQRGVFYTPQPVVSYIVRSVHELLQKEFDLADGLADTTTWGEMLAKHPQLRLPLLTDELGEKRTISPNEPFVQILDPATGTATFLVEVIDVVHRTLQTKWKQQGLTDMRQHAAWNEYVPKHLLPRLHAFELMMAPYAIAHMKIGLKLHETGYRFGAEERARIYLTNALEPYVKQLPLISVDALAHEAVAVNEIKRHKRFTVIIGNPPYSGVSSNMTAYAQRIVDAYKIVDGGALNERKLWLQDDYVKFFRKAQTTIDSAGVGVLGYITNHGYLDNPTFRGMRQSLMATFPRLHIVDLHGNANKKEQCPDGSEDKNVFDIRQGVAICVATSGGSGASINHADLWGPRETKYAWLSKHHVGTTVFSTLLPDSPYYFFEPQNTHCRAEYDQGWKINEVMPVNSAGFITARDHFVVDFDRDALLFRIADFANPKLSDQEIRRKYFEGCGSKKYADGDTRSWKVPAARKRVQSDKFSRDHVRRCLYRPFDEREVYWVDWMVDWPRPELTRHLDIRGNKALITTRIAQDTFSVFVSDLPPAHKSVSAYDVNYVFPLMTAPSTGAQRSLVFGDGKQHPNFAAAFLKALAIALGLPQSVGGLPRGVTAEDIFCYVYGVLHSPGYRNRYAEFLKIDFPRLPLTGNRDLFFELVKFGGELSALHLLESPNLNHATTEFIGGRNQAVEKVTWLNDAVWFDKAQTTGFKGVPRTVWNFRIGGYQVCEKWLKDRKGRTLSNEDITHYRKITVALSETIRLMAEIDTVIEKYGGWPGAFATTMDEGKESQLGTAPTGPIEVEPTASVRVFEVTRAPQDLFASTTTASNDATEPVKRVADVDDLDRNDLCVEVRQLFASGGARSRDAAIVELARALGYQRTGQNIRETLDNAIRTAVRRGILLNDGDGLRLRYRTIEHFEADDRDGLKEQFLASLSGHSWVERDDATVEFARWMGFRRAGQRIVEIAASLINGLLREQRIEAQGSEIRRTRSA